MLQQLVGRLPRGAAARVERLLGLAACPPPGAPLAWHPSQPLLAAVGAGGQVQVVDYTGQLPVLGQQGSGSPPPPPLAPALTLQHELQQGAAAAAWRPNGGKCLAVGTAQGVCLWHIGRPPAGSGSRSDGSAWMVWLKAPTAGTVTTLSWHPQGHLLAGASPASPGFFVWDVATGTATPISAGPEPACLLRWSPCGSYLLAAQPGGAFRIWETQTWWSQSWAAAEGGSSAGGRLVEAAWGPDCRSLLLAYDGSPQLVSLHFTGEPPSLQAQLLPLPLAELSSGGAKGGAPGLVQAVAWDTQAQRLAIALGGPHPAAGCVALYDTRCDPILSARFIGFLRLGPLGGSGGSGSAAGGSRAAAAFEPEWEEIRPEEVAEAAAAAGSGAGAAQRRAAAGSGSGIGGSGAPGAGSEAPQALVFLPCFGQGAVLAARCGDQRIATVPLYFAA
ncbi:hypothetical protein COHA_006733 [Chlorella ohadii]|uniref:Aladin n=1 Tax=Chlorella ohadii TaxID=2649997 RepID=A0AAD5H426_9CHLO|nr:hypothetical protein COHA_006733 [Chlorella ohadii]